MALQPPISALGTLTAHSLRAIARSTLPPTYEAYEKLARNLISGFLPSRSGFEIHLRSLTAGKQQDPLSELQPAFIVTWDQDPNNAEIMRERRSLEAVPLESPQLYEYLIAEVGMPNDDVAKMEGRLRAMCEGTINESQEVYGILLLGTVMRGYRSEAGVLTPLCEALDLRTRENAVAAVMEDIRDNPLPTILE